VDLSSLLPANGGDGSTGFVVTGVTPNEESGHSVSGAGDVNGDGFDDLLIGARKFAGGFDDQGKAFVLYGKSDRFAASLDLGSLDGSTGFVLRTVDLFSVSDVLVSGAGDINGDGFDDLIVGVPKAGQEGRGESYVLFGTNFSGGPETQTGTDADDTLTATRGAAVDILIGGRGSDTLISDGGPDVLRGAEGDDILAILDADFSSTRRLQGGNGTDTLRLDGSGINLNLTTIADNRIVDVEVLDITGNGPNSLALDQQEVLNISSHSNTLTVFRDADDAVSRGNGWTQQVNLIQDGRTFEVFTQGAATLVLQTTSTDFGDAPAPYPTTRLQNGARHTIGSLFLGSTVDAEPDGQPSDNADGDDTDGNDDEDGGVVVASILTTAGTATTSSLAVTASNAAIANGLGKLDAWIDFNQDGDWDDADEQIFDTTDLAAGLNLLQFTVPAGAASGVTAARFRVSPAGGLAPTGEATDGEVEDYLLTILDGDAASGTEVELFLPVSGTLDVVASGDDLVVRSGTLELFRAPAAILNRLDIRGTAGDDTLNLANLDAIFTGVISGDAGPGNDTLRLSGSGQFLDLTDIPDNLVQNFETIDIRGNGNNTLTLDVAEVVNMSDTSDELIVLSDIGDTVNFGPGWSLTGTEITDGAFFRVLEQGGATLRLDGPANWQNPIAPHDVNNDGHAAVTPQADILPLINEINIQRILQENGRLPNPPTESIVFFYDVNGDGFLTPVGDILQQINAANGVGSSESEGDTTQTMSTVDLVFASVGRAYEQPIVRPENAATRSVRTNGPGTTRLAAKPMARRFLITRQVDLLVTEELDDLLEPELRLGELLDVMEFGNEDF